MFDGLGLGAKRLKPDTSTPPVADDHRASEGLLELIKPG